MENGEDSEKSLRKTHKERYSQGQLDQIEEEPTFFYFSISRAKLFVVNNEGFE